MANIRLKRRVLRALHRVPGMEPLGIARKLHEPVAIVEKALGELQADGTLVRVKTDLFIKRFVRQLRRERRAVST